jgi:signal transduction histidine kinase
MLVTQQQIVDLNKREASAHTIQAGASDLSYISNNYFLYQENSSISLWQAKFATLSGEVSLLNSTDPYERSLVDTVRTDLDRLNIVFAEVVSFLTNIGRNFSVHELPIFQTQWNRMAVQIQGLAFDSQQLSQVISDQIDQANLTNIILTITSISSFGAFFIVSFLITFRGTLKSIARLKTGISKIGSGNLDYTFEVGKKDEIADISNSINHMAANLKRLTASKDDLEKVIEERKKAEKEIVSVAKFPSENPFPVLRVDKDGLILFANPSANHSLKEWQIKVGGCIPERVKQMVVDALDSGEKSEFEEAVGGDIFSFLVVPIVPEVYVNIYGRGITKRKKAEEALLQAQLKLQEYASNLECLVEERTKQLKDSERLAAIGATAGMVGHDIRNPLQAITSDVYLAKIELASVPDAEWKTNALESLTEIEKNVTYINKIVQDLQDYARPLKPIAKKLNLPELIEDLIRKNGIPEEIKVGVKVQKEAANIVADPEIIRRVLANLMTNAVQAMPEGGKLSIRIAEESNDVVITVQDTGVGIPEETKARLFTPLFTTKSKGQGFGLAVVKRMVEAMGGTVTFESEIGKGTKFIIRFPSKC